MSAQLDYNRLKPRRGWKDQILASFPEADVLTPNMPNRENAKYREWCIWFEKIVDYFDDDVRLVGHSLGAMFLAKYLHEQPLMTPVKQLHLLAGGYNDNIAGYGSFALNSATGLEKSADEIHLYHSEDDPVVPYSELDKFVRDLPSAHAHRFSNRNHFLDETFPELLEILKK